MVKLYKPTAEELKTILDNHKHWLRKDYDGWEKMKADMSYYDLNGANLYYANLYYANLNGASLDHANLYHANLDYANLNGASLYHANLNGASLNYANLYYANLNGANLNYARGITMACPSDGAFTAWKKAWHDAGRIAIIKLQIPEDAKRSSATGRMCRADKAVVLAIFDITGDEIDSAYSDRDHAFVYRKGETVVPDAFDNNRWNECSHGIHFFITRQEAEEYEL